MVLGLQQHLQQDDSGEVRGAVVRQVFRNMVTQADWRRSVLDIIADLDEVLRNTLGWHVHLGSRKVPGCAGAYGFGRDAQPIGNDVLWGPQCRC